jgi:SAM-dependent methyltransferase
MNVPDPRRTVEDGYDRIAERHAAWALETRTEERARYAAVLLDRLPEGAEVLELGCGAGGPTTRALAARFRLTGVDISARSVELARQAVPGARFLHADMTRLELPAESVDGVAAFYSIIHVPRDEHAALFARIATWLRPGGVLVAALGAQDTAAGYEPDWLGAPMYWSGYHAPIAQGVVAAAGLQLERAVVETADEDGQPVSFLWVVARKPAGEPPV